MPARSSWALRSTVGPRHRPGTRFGPQAIRFTDYLAHDGMRPHLALGVDPLTELPVVDAGDVHMLPGEIEQALQRLEQAVTTIAQAGPIPVVLGGDHTITFPDATGVARHVGWGRVALVHFDAHADTADTQYGSLYGHGTPMRRLIESGAVRGDRFFQIGLRGYWPPEDVLDWMAGQNMRSYEMTEVVERGLDTCLDEVFDLAMDGCDAVFLSVDIDVVDPGSAPGTGTPEPGGLSARALLDAVRRSCERAPRRRGRRRRGLPAVRPRRDHRLPCQPGRPGSPVGYCLAAQVRQRRRGSGAERTAAPGPFSSGQLNVAAWKGQQTRRRREGQDVMPQSPHAEKNDEGMGHARLAFSIRPCAIRQKEARYDGCVTSEDQWRRRAERASPARRKVRHSSIGSAPSER